MVEYGKRRPDAKQSLREWYEAARHGNWNTPQDIKSQIATASFVAPDRVVFNIKGNSHRLVVAVDYALQAIYIKFIGNHAEYDRIDVATVEMR